jgi:hypothetical protein
MAKLKHTGKLASEVIVLAKEKKECWIVPLIVVLALPDLVIVASQSGRHPLFTPCSKKPL